MTYDPSIQEQDNCAKKEELTSIIGPDRLNEGSDPGGARKEDTE